MQLYNGDCLEIMQDIPDNSINLVLIDPPYNIGKDKKWDKWKTVEGYVEFMGIVFLEIQRVLKDNGSFYFFHNDFMQIVELQNFINKNTNFVFNSFCIWDKGDFRAIAWKNPEENNKLRCWFNTCEYCLAYTFQTNLGLSKNKPNEECFKNLREYFYNEKEKNNLTYKDINKVLGSTLKGGGMASHYFGMKFKQWNLPTKEMYKKLQTNFEGAFLKNYEELKEEYENARYTHNVDNRHNNVWKTTENNRKLHSCQKPLDILERIIRTSSNEGDVVLDCFMGSGSTGVACVNTNRHFIGIEKEEKYFEIAKERIENLN